MILLKSVFTSDKRKFKDFSRHGDIDNYIANHAGAEWLEYRSKWKNVTQMKEFYEYPLYITMEQHFNCNYRCIMCYHYDREQYNQLNHKQRLGKDEIKKIIDQAAELGTPSLCMNAGNEPLMDKDIYELVGYARKKGIIDVFMTTNGSLLSEELSERLVEAGLTQIRVSIDAFSDKTYSMIRTGQDLNRVKQNVFKLIEIKNKKQSFFPIIRVSFVEMSVNVDEFEDFKNYWKDKVDYVSIQRFTPVNLSEKMLSLTPPAREHYKNTVCSMPFSMIYIRGNGDVYPCGRVEYGTMIGNIREKHIRDIWLGKQAEEVRRLLLKLNYDEMPGCGNCFRSASLI